MGTSGTRDRLARQVAGAVFDGHDPAAAAEAAGFNTAVTHRPAVVVAASNAGDVAAARKEWEQGTAIAADLQMPYEEGRLRLSLGRLSKDRAELETARDLFESTGAAPFADLARSALRET